MGRKWIPKIRRNDRHVNARETQTWPVARQGKDNNAYSDGYCFPLSIPWNSYLNNYLFTHAETAISSGVLHDPW